MASLFVGGGSRLPLSIFFFNKYEINLHIQKKKSTCFRKINIFNVCLF
jgi:hypothetical protein